MRTFSASASRVPRRALQATSLQPMWTPPSASSGTLVVHAERASQRLAKKQAIGHVGRGQHGDHHGDRAAQLRVWTEWRHTDGIGNPARRT